MPTVCLIMYVVSQVLVIVMILMCANRTNRTAKLILELIDLMQQQGNITKNHRRILKKLLLRKKGWGVDIESLETENIIKEKTE